MTTVCPIPQAATEAAFARALDRELLQQLVRDQLGDGEARVELAPDYVRWKGADGSIIGWHARVGDDRAPSYVTVRTAPPARLQDEAQKLSHRADEETDVWQRSLALVPDQELLLVGFPLDRQMPDLRRLVRASKVRSVMVNHRPDLVPESLRISKSRSARQIVRYKPERRAVLRWDLGFKGGDASVADFTRTVWFRLLAQPLPARQPAAAAAAAAGIRVPELLSAPKDTMLLEGHVEGTPWHAPDPAPLDAVAATLARLHGAAVPDEAPVRDREDELQLVEQAVRDLGQLTPEHGRMAAALAQDLAARMPAARPRRLLHGDFHCGQVLIGADAGLCDFDRACQGPIGADLAAFHAHAVYDDARGGAAFAAAFAAAYGACAELPPPAELAWWNCCALVRMAATPFRTLRADWPDACARLLDGARAALTEGA
ncbi:MAG: phosphotransferase [Planctomycetota bacterium]